MIGEDQVRARLRSLPVFDVQLPEFDTQDVPAHPDALFLAWLDHAIDAGLREPHAMTLSTVDAAGRPNSRVLILKQLRDGRWGFATSRESRKGRELGATPWAALSFHWPQVGRQIRVRGRVVDAGAEEATQDFLARSPGSRAESWAGHQSQILRNPADLEAALAEAHARLEADPDAVPEQWSRYDVLADEVEFWQADRQRRHHRLQYTLTGGIWRRETLWP